MEQIFRQGNNLDRYLDTGTEIQAGQQSRTDIQIVERIFRQGKNLDGYSDSGTDIQAGQQSGRIFR